MESATINNSINAIKEVRKLFNDVRNNLSHEERKSFCFFILVTGLTVSKMFGVRQRKQKSIFSL